MLINSLDWIVPIGNVPTVYVMRGNVEKFDYASSKKVISRDENLATLCSSDVGHTDESLSRRRQKKKKKSKEHDAT